MPTSWDFSVCSNFGILSVPCSIPKVGERVRSKKRSAGRVQSISKRIVGVPAHSKMSSGGQVIRATQMFLKQGAGASKGVNLKAELLYGTTLGIGVGIVWKVMHSLSVVRQSRCSLQIPALGSLHLHQSFLPLQVYHWNDKRIQAEYYNTLARLEKQKEA